MKSVFFRIMSMVMIAVVLSSCARDLSNSVYTSDDTMSLVIQGKIVSTRPVTIKESDKLSGNQGGLLAGGLAGGALGATALQHNRGSNNAALLITGGVLLGALVGSVVEGGLSKADGIEYIVKVDRKSINDSYFDGSLLVRSALSGAKATGILNIVQGTDNPMKVGENVYIVLSPKRARIVAAQ